LEFGLNSCFLFLQLFQEACIGRFQFAVVTLAFGNLLLENSLCRLFYRGAVGGEGIFKTGCNIAGECCISGFFSK